MKGSIWLNEGITCTFFKYFRINISRHMSFSGIFPFSKNCSNIYRLYFHIFVINIQSKKGIPFQYKSRFLFVSFFESVQCLCKIKKNANHWFQSDLNKGTKSSNIDSMCYNWFTSFFGFLWSKRGCRLNMSPTTQLKVNFSQLEVNFHYLGRIFSPKIYMIFHLFFRLLWLKRGSWLNIYPMAWIKVNFQKPKVDFHYLGQIFSPKLNTIFHLFLWLFMV